MLDYEEDADNNHIRMQPFGQFCQNAFPLQNTFCRNQDYHSPDVDQIYDHDLSAFYSIFHPWWDGILNLRDADKYRLSIARTKNAFWVVIRAATGVLPNIDQK